MLTSDSYRKLAGMYLVKNAYDDFFNLRLNNMKKIIESSNINSKKGISNRLDELMQRSKEVQKTIFLVIDQEPDHHLKIAYSMLLLEILNQYNSLLGDWLTLMKMDEEPKYIS